MELLTSYRILLRGPQIIVHILFLDPHQVGTDEPQRIIGALVHESIYSIS